MADCAACRSLASASSTGGGPGRTVAVWEGGRTVPHTKHQEHKQKKNKNIRNTWSHISHWLRKARWEWQETTGLCWDVPTASKVILPATDLRCRRLESETCPVPQCILLLQISLGVLRQCPSSYHIFFCLGVVRPNEVCWKQLLQGTASKYYCITLKAVESRQTLLHLEDSKPKRTDFANQQLEKGKDFAKSLTNAGPRCIYLTIALGIQNHGFSRCFQHFHEVFPAKTCNWAVQQQAHDILWQYGCCIVKWYVIV